MQHSPAGGRWSLSRLTVVLVAMAVIGAGCAGNTIHLRDKEAGPARVSAATTDSVAPAPAAGTEAAAPVAEPTAAPAPDTAATAATGVAATRSSWSRSVAAPARLTVPRSRM